MSEIFTNIAQLTDGVVTIATELPGQAIRTAKMLPPENRKAILRAIKRRVGLGDVMSYTPYYGGNPQLFRMPMGQAEAAIKEGEKKLSVLALGAILITGIAVVMMLKK